MHLRSFVIIFVIIFARPSSSLTDRHHVADLKKQLTSAELKNKRLMEAFKKTSQEFREICYQLLGYRIGNAPTSYAR